MTARSVGTAESGYLRRMLLLLGASISAESTTSVTEIAASLSMPVSTASRLLACLEQWGYLAPGSGGSRIPGVELIELARRTAVTVFADSALEQLVARLAVRIGESVTAGRLVGDRLVIVARAESPLALRVVYRQGEVLPVTRTAMGKALLSTLSPATAAAVIDREVPRSEAETRVILGKELDGARKSGYARDEEQLAKGLRCRAVPVRAWSGATVAALSVGGPVDRFTYDAAERAVELLMEEVHRVRSGPAGSAVDGVPS